MREVCLGEVWEGARAWVLDGLSAGDGLSAPGGRCHAPLSFPACVDSVDTYLCV